MAPTHLSTFIVILSFFMIYKITKKCNSFVNILFLRKQPQKQYRKKKILSNWQKNVCDGAQF